MEPVDLSELRSRLVAAGLPRALREEDPVGIVERWIADARRAGLFNPDAMALASVDNQGRPSVRNVLMRRVIEGGLCFYTNYNSQKGTELAANPATEALFSWLVLERQIRVSGAVERLDAGESDDYFDDRPRGSQIAAHASDQSRQIVSREFLDSRFARESARFEGRDVTRPEHWGGFRIVPEKIEFWQGQPNRLHYRLLFTRDGDSWSTSLLAP